jgi:hypothetical protein
MNDEELQAKLHDFSVRREAILVRIKEQKLQLARLDLHYAQFMADIAASPDQLDAQPTEEIK